MRIVQVFGNNGSGKTQLLRNLAASDPWSKVIRGKSPHTDFTVCPNLKMVLIGNYENITASTNAGADLITNKKNVLESLDTAITLAEPGQMLVLEGIIVMTRQYLPEYKLRRLVTSHVFLDLPIELCIERVLSRSGKVLNDLKDQGRVIRDRHYAIDSMRAWSLVTLPDSTHLLDATRPASDVLDIFLKLADGWALTDKNNEPSAEDIFGTAVSIVRKFWEIRNNEYAGSWCKHGLTGATMNLFRKTDRLDVWLRAMDLGQQKDLPVDTFFDAAAYSMAILAWIIKNRPDEYAAWVSEQSAKYPEFQAFTIQLLGDRNGGRGQQ